MKFQKLNRSLCGFLLLLFLCLTAFASAQVTYIPAPKKDPPPPRNLKVLSEESDGKGNIVTIVQYDQGMMRVTETIIKPNPIYGKKVYGVINPDTMLKDQVTVLVDKSKYNVQVYYRKHMIRNYKATFGPNPKQDKCMEGDRCTPEGWFTITNKNPTSKYTKFLGLNYPNDSATARFSRLKAQGILPKSARIGSDIGIHGIWQGGDELIELGVGWTDGCVALKNRDVEELFTMVGIGTRVYIRK